MPAFYILVFIGLLAVWLLLSSLYRPIGKLFKTLIKDAADMMDKDD